MSSPSSTRISQSNSSQSSRNSRNRRTNYVQDHVPLCDCQSVAPLRTSWTSLNPGRRFYGCINYGTIRFCNFMRWIDPEFTDRLKDVILSLLDEKDDCFQHNRKLRDENTCLKRDMLNLKDEVAASHVEIRQLREELARQTGM